jgi:hypothetical protein
MVVPSTRLPTSGVSIVLLLLAPVLAGACVSLDGLSGGSDAGGDAFVKPVRDATTDRSTAPVEASTPDAGHDTGEDAHLDGAAPDAPRDAGTDGSHAVDAGDAGDAGDDAPPCHPLAFEAGVASQCPAAEAGACAPRSANDAGIPTPAWRPPHVVLNACTPAQSATFFEDCFGATASGAACAAFVATQAGQDCASCMVSDISAAEYGPLINVGGFVVVNTGGCIALADPCDEPCAAANVALDLCESQACSASCLTPPLSQADIDAFDGCANLADTCLCAAEHQQASACNAVLSAQPSTARCFVADPSNLTPTVMQVAPLFCGTGAWATDAGS